MYIDGFHNPEALRFCKARLEHLDSLNLDLANKTVNDYGAGPGILTLFFTDKKCSVTAYDARNTHKESFKISNPDCEFIEIDLEQGEWPLVKESQIGFSYGLLYHLSNPENFLKNVAKKNNRHATP